MRLIPSNTHHAHRLMAKTLPGNHDRQIIQLFKQLDSADQQKWTIFCQEFSQLISQIESLPRFSYNLTPIAALLIQKLQLGLSVLATAKPKIFQELTKNFQAFADNINRLLSTCQVNEITQFQAVSAALFLNLKPDQLKQLKLKDSADFNLFMDVLRILNSALISNTTIICQLQNEVVKLARPPVCQLKTGWQISQQEKSSILTPDGGTYNGICAIRPNGTYAPDGDGEYVGPNQRFKGHFKGFFGEANFKGKGELTLVDPLNGDTLIYRGFFNADLLNGCGIQISKGSIYRGWFKDGQFSGWGDVYSVDGGCYSGNFVRGRKQGYGNYFYKNGNTYQGEFLNDKYHGKGIYKDNDGSKYIGEFKEDNFHGKGLYRFSSGEYYLGDFTAGFITGNGTIYYKDGNKYQGSLTNGQRHGFGRMYYKSGSEYEGNFSNDLRSGDGKIYVKGDYTYTGTFSNNEINGSGTFRYCDGAEYIGEVKNGKYEGKGSLTNLNGSKYVGQFKDNQFHGEGELTIGGGGPPIKGLFSNGQPVRVSARKKK